MSRTSATLARWAAKRGDRRTASLVRLRRAGNGLIVLTVGSAELALGIATMLDPSWLGKALVLHAWLVGALLLPMVDLLRSRGQRRHLLFAIVSIAALGPLGAAGAMLTGLLSWGLVQRAVPFVEWYGSLFPSAPHSPARELYERIMLRGGGPSAASSVAPFCDVMSGRSEKRKQTVISLIAENFRPEFAPPLMRALNDEDGAVRVQAATAAARIESRFLVEAIRLEQARAASPADTTAMLALARHCEAYGRSGMLEAARAREALLQALSLYEHADRRQPGEPELGKAIGRLLLRLDRVEEAAARFGAEVQRGTASARTFAWYAESLYRLHRWENLRELCRRYRAPLLETAELGEDLRRAVLFWTDDPVQEGASP